MCVWGGGKWLLAGSLQAAGWTPSPPRGGVPFVLVPSGLTIADPCEPHFSSQEIREFLIKLWQVISTRTLYFCSRGKISTREFIFVLRSQVIKSSDPPKISFVTPSKVFVVSQHFSCIWDCPRKARLAALAHALPASSLPCPALPSLSPTRPTAASSTLGRVLQWRMRTRRPRRPTAPSGRRPSNSLCPGHGTFQARWGRQKGGRNVCISASMFAQMSALQCALKLS